ncbi:MAG: XdhC family protein [Jatrophihabitans sp.]
MYTIAEQVSGWLDAGFEVKIAQVVATKGFSSRDHAAALAWHDNEPPVGTLLDAVALGPVDGDGLVDVTVTAEDARTGGLSCGGVAAVLVQSASAYPAELWDQLSAREPVCITTTIEGGEPVGTTVYSAATIRGAHELGDQVPRLFARGTSLTTVVEDDGTTRAVVCLWPVPSLLVVGDGLIATALADTAGLLGWNAATTNDVGDAVDAVADLHRGDAFVVLSHDRAVDGPALAAALAGNVGYVGALGSRRTQELRREWLTGHGVAPEMQDRIHGPAGLDIDAHTPGEIAISIVAEILGSRTSAGGGALRDRPGPVHPDGINAPPPRYEPGTPRLAADQ